jgi:hypothetical protein
MSGIKNRIPKERAPLVFPKGPPEAKKKQAPLKSISSHTIPSLDPITLNYEKAGSDLRSPIASPCHNSDTLEDFALP